MFKMWPVSSPSLTDPKSGLDPTIVASEEAPVSDTATSSPSPEGQLDVDVSSAGLQRMRSVSNDSATLSGNGNDGPPTPTPPTKRSRLAAPISVGHTFSITDAAVNSTALSESLSYSKLEVEAADGHVVLHSTIPDGFAIVDNEVFEGKKIVATRDFKRGELLYVASAALLDLSAVEHKHEVKIYSEDQNGSRNLLEVVSNTDTHSVDDHAVGSKSGIANKRQVYGWDSFMNHSCMANAYFPLLHRTESELCYQAIALRDIDVGMEVTCDYALFDYHCSGHEISVCACGSKKCRGKMLGFHAMSIQEKVNVLHLCEDEIKDKFISTENIKVFKSILPNGIDIATVDGDNKYHIATRNFEPGDVIFSNRVEIISTEELESGEIYVLELDGGFHLLDKDQHFVHRSEYAEMLGFDSFMDHSCAPNTYQVYNNKEEYTVYASKTIVPGDKITCDYQALDNTAVGLKNVGTSTFKCLCGERNCYGILVC